MCEEETMNGETYQIARLVSAAKKAMHENAGFSFPQSPYEKSIIFRFVPQKRFFQLRERVAPTPGEWFETCRKEGLRDMFLLMDTASPDPRLLGFVNTKPINITVVYKNGKARFWTPKWTFDSAHKQWDIEYTEHMWEDAPFRLPTFVDNTDDFRSVLTEIEEFAGRIGANSFAAIFGKARSILDEKDFVSESLGFPELPAKNRVLFGAAMTADVFGAMGSWNDSPPFLAHEKGLDAEYKRLSAELLKQIRLATLFAVNQWT